MKRYLLLISGMLISMCLKGAVLTDTLRVGWTEAPPFIYMENGKPDGLNMRIWKRVGDDLGLEYTMVHMDFQEILSGLESGSIDLTIMPLSVTHARNEVFDYTMPYFTSHGAIAVAEPDSWEKFLNTLNIFLDSNFLRGIFLLVAIIFLFGILGWYFEWKKNPEHFRKGIRGIWDGVWWSAVTLTTVGYGDKTPKTVWGRIAALLLMFGGLLFVSGITASIASSVTISELNRDFSSLDHFKAVPVGTVDSSQTEDYLRAQFFRDIRTYPYLEEGLEALLKKEIQGFMYDEEILRNEIKKLSISEEIQILPLKFNAKFYSFGMIRGQDSLREKISREIVKIRDQATWQVLLHEFGLSDFN